MSEYTAAGAADPTKVRSSTLLDLLGATVVAMLVYPQPVVRQALSGAGMPVWVFMATLLIATLLVFGAYQAVCLLVWGRTPAMYLFDLGLDPAGRPRWSAALLWGIGWSLAAVPTLVGLRGAFDPLRAPAVRFSGLRVVAAVTPGTSRPGASG